ncbi:MAG: type I-C CRISPR-associated protein Cas7/Csd2 [Desulfuromonadales bacterium]|nr:type I-C CRISPR-associated protein Cas7/Csd2 [Desulfuromonadales bacterium]MBN2791686.1 type I-C CRISPR-associated protein Cas7/Csd2 [Desulfuromonadales bacterium]
MSKAIQNRYEFVLLYDVTNGNPNGDPDGGNLPRIDPETGHGIATDVCLKRKIRNYVELTKEDQTPFNIYVKEGAILSERRKPAYDSVEDKKDKAGTVSQARSWMCKNFFDVRSFGAVMSTKENNCGQVRGPVQMSFSRSVDRIVPLDASITRMAVETKAEAEERIKKGSSLQTMGRKAYIPYGLYVAHGFISAPLAQQTGFSDQDLELLWNALTNMFEHDRSAARGLMSSQKLFVFKHADKLGNAPAHKLFDLIDIKRNDRTEGPARSFKDYDVTVGAAPAGVEIIEKL